LSVFLLSAVSCRLSAVLGKEHQRQSSEGNYPSTMKFLIIVAVLAALAGIAYKVLTTEIPIDES